MRLAVALGLFVLVGPVAASANPTKPYECLQGGSAHNPLIRSEAAARAAYRARVWARTLRRYPVIVVEDSGDHWHVSQTTRERAPQPGDYTEVCTNGECVVTTLYTAAGGGQISMDIDKCSGAISNFSINK